MLFIDGAIVSKYTCHHKDYDCKEMISFLLRALATRSSNSSDGIRLSRGLSSLEITCWDVLISFASCACEIC